MLEASWRTADAVVAQRPAKPTRKTFGRALYAGCAWKSSRHREQTMIAKLTGILDDTGPDWAIIDVNGVGYLVHCSAKTLTHLGVRGDKVVVHTEMQVSETDQRLIGFASAGERVVPPAHRGSGRGLESGPGDPFGPRPRNCSAPAPGATRPWSPAPMAWGRNSPAASSTN
jgi:hypothetical protein